MKKIIFSLAVFFSLIGVCFAYYEAPVDITEMDIYEIQDAIDKGYLTYELLIRLYLDRINTYDKKFNSIISINETAVEEAKECDANYKKNGRDSILYCMPIIVKDNIDVKGLPTTAGSKSLSDSYPNSDSSVVSKLKNKGMIVLAKSNMSEFAFLAGSSTSSYGTVHNAYNLDYSSYGSSGGSAVAVSLSFAPFALGTDTNSSLRAPASANGVIGFRSTLGLIDTKGILAYDITRDVVGPITKNVKENALLMEVMTDSKEGVYSDFTNASLEGKTIAILDQFAYGDSSVGVYGTGKPYSEIKKLFDKSIKKMEDAGANIIHLDDFYSSKYYYIEEKTLAGSTMCYAFNKYIKNTSSKINNFYDLASSKGHIYSLWEYYDECSIDIDNIKKYDEIKEDYRKHVSNVFDKYDIDAFVYPTTKNRVSKIKEDNFESSSFAISPVLGLPAVSVPLGFDKDGLSYGIEFVSNKNNEKVLYDIIYSYEQLNNVYKLSSLTPSLYEVPEDVLKLKTLYEDDSLKIIHFFNVGKIKKYNDAYNKVSSFFLNYNDYEDKSSEASILYDELLNSKNNINNNISFVFVIAVIILVLFLMIKIKVKNAKKKRRYRRSKYRKKVYNKK